MLWLKSHYDVPFLIGYENMVWYNSSCCNVNSALFGIGLEPNYFNLTKIFAVETIQNGSKSKCTRLEQRYVIEFLLTEKCKPCEIYRRICDVNGEAYFSQEMFTNGLNMG